MREFSHPPFLPSVEPFCAILCATLNENRSGFLSDLFDCEEILACGGSKTSLSISG